MASNFPYFFLTALVLLVAATPLAHANTLLGNKRLVVTGQVCCNANGACPGTGLSGVTVRLVCQDIFGNTNTIATATTTSTGTFTITAGPRSPFPATRVASCVVRLTTPVPTCAALATAGELVSTPIVISGTTSGIPQTINATATGFTFVPA